ncbi:hypothetical protein [Psychrobacter sp. I-STPA6b]|uniref:hypothetical protein n=1 Tax=Psychrobacter sp. I-STPA6b TaxID=2585718 RepID=UPI001D0CBF99|nr:hypothetical protein [Psychrobacter sp. I-STPA6b]
MVNQQRSKIGESNINNIRFYTYYLSCLAVSAFVLVGIGSYILTFFEFIDVAHLILPCVGLIYYINLIFIGSLYPGKSVKKHTKEFFILILILIFLHKSILSLMGGIGGFVVNGMYYSIAISCLFRSKSSDITNNVCLTFILKNLL